MKPPLRSVRASVWSLACVLSASAATAASAPPLPSRTATLPAPARAALPASGAPAAAPEREVRLLGEFSGPDENADTEADATFVPPIMRGGRIASPGSDTPSGISGSGAMAPGGALDVGTVPLPLSNHPKAPEWIQRLEDSLRASAVDVALLGSHKYMVGDCLGIKVSAGTFQLRLDQPRVWFQGTALVFECGIEHVSFSAIKLRMKPNPNVLELCKFSKKFEVGGSASDVTLRLKMDPVVDLEHCRIYSSVTPEVTVRIGNLNLKPLQNDLDKAAKNAVEDALTAFLNFNFQDQITRVLDDMIEADCPGGDAREGIENAFGLDSRGGTGGGGGDTAGTGDANVAGLARRLEQLETRVTQLEQQLAASPPAANGASPAAGAASPRGAAPPTYAAGRADAPLAPAPDAGPGRSAAPGLRAAAGRGTWGTIVPNAELRGRLGRIVIRYPAPAGVRELVARTEFFKAGEARGVRAEFGDLAVEMTPGTYDLDVNGRRLTGVIVEPRSDTNIDVGVLFLHGSPNTRFELFEVGGENGLQTAFGEKAVGLPVGTYEVEVNGQRETVTIRADAITDY